MVVFFENNIALSLKANETMSERVAEHIQFFLTNQYLYFHSQPRSWIRNNHLTPLLPLYTQHSKS